MVSDPAKTAVSREIRTRPKHQLKQVLNHVSLTRAHNNKSLAEHFSKFSNKRRILRLFQDLSAIEKNCRFLCYVSILSKSEFFRCARVRNHIQTALVLISYPGIFLGFFYVGLLRGLGNPHPVSGRNVKTDQYHTLESNTVKLMQF